MNEAKGKLQPFHQSRIVTEDSGMMTTAVGTTVLNRITQISGASFQRLMAGEYIAVCESQDGIR